MGRIIENVPLRRGNFGDGIGAEVQRLRRDHALYGGEGIHQLTRFVMHHAVAGHNVLFGVKLENSVGQDDRLAGFLVPLLNGDRPHLRGVVNGDALRNEFNGLIPVEQGHVVHGRILYIAVRGGLFRYRVSAEV